MSTIKFDTLSNLAGSQSVPVATVAQGSAKAWVNFNGAGTVAIRASFNVTSITDNGTGNYTVNFTNAMADANYSASVSARRSNFDNADFSAMVKGGGSYTPTTTTLPVCTGNASNGVFVDTDFVSVVIFR